MTDGFQNILFFSGDRAGEHVHGKVIEGLGNHGRAGTQHQGFYLTMNVCEYFFAAIIQN